MNNKTKNEEMLDIFNNYSIEAHNNILYENINQITFSVKPIKSSLWTGRETTPYVSVSYLLDSYSCLPQRPDMAFTFLWKSINSCYKKLAIKDILDKGGNDRLTDSKGIDCLIEKIDKEKNNPISSANTIINLFNEYLKVIPIKPCRFLSNQILKGYVMHEAGIKNLMIGSTHSSFKTSHPDLYKKITSTYGEAYKAITKPIINNYIVDLRITNVHKSKTIPQSLAEKLKELIINKSVEIKYPGKTSSVNLTISSDKELIQLLIKSILYSIRNNSVHGNVVSRLNSAYVNNDSLKAAIYIYFFGHFILSLAMYVNKDIELEDLNVNVDNLKILVNLLQDQ